jgi:ATP-dependent helicase HrpB
VALLRAFPDRIARRRKPGGRELALSGLANAELDEASSVRHAPFLIALRAEHQDGGRLRVGVAHGIAEELLIDVFADRIIEEETPLWQTRDDGKPLGAGRPYPH